MACFLVPLWRKTVRLSKTGRGLIQGTKNTGKDGNTGVTPLGTTQFSSFILSPWPGLARLGSAREIGSIDPGTGLVDPGATACRHRRRLRLTPPPARESGRHGRPRAPSAASVGG